MNHKVIRIELRKYEWHRLTESSQKRLAKILSDERLEKVACLDDRDLTPTIYFDYGKE